MTEPNAALRAVRASLRMSQDEFAKAIRGYGEQAGEPNDCTKRLVQRWEHGFVAMPRGVYVRALEAVTGQPMENLGFTAADERYGLNRREALGVAAAAPAEPHVDDKSAPAGPLTGIWRSRYEYVSSGRGVKTFASEHYVLILHRGSRLQLRSLPDTALSRVVMDLTVNGQVITGTWTEQTNPSGYYQGAVYHGAIQMLLEPSGRRMAGKWVGFGRDFDLNTGPWTLQLVSAGTGNEALATYNRPVEETADPATV